MGLVVFALVLSGCRDIIDDLIDDGNDGNGDNPFDVFKGVWANPDVPVLGAVQIAVNEPAENGYSEADAAYNQFFKGRVTCSIFSQGNLDIVEAPSDLLQSNYLWAIIMKENQEIDPGERTLGVRAIEEGGSGFEMGGSLEDDDTLKVTSLCIFDEDEEIYDLDDDDNNEYLIFEKQ